LIWYPLNQKPKLAADAFRCGFVAKNATNASNRAFESLDYQLLKEPSLEFVTQQALLSELV
jgi:hypothetical protein